jgi:calcineurin-like phosphoesterase family protein
MTLSYRRAPAVWFTSDWHLGHERIIDLCHRPFESVAQMNEEIIDNHNALVEDTDVVWMLGDMIMGDIEAGLKLVSRINGRKHLICGNHDRPFAGATTDPRKRADWRARYLDAGFASVVTGTGIARTQKYRGQDRPVGLPVQIRLGFAECAVIMSHFPYEGDTQADDRFAAWRPRRPAGKNPPWLLCGHVHDAWDIRVPERTINVGVDIWSFAPLAADDIVTMIKEASPE